jgi:RNA polymerase sigma-32 factor
VEEAAVLIPEVLDLDPFAGDEVDPGDGETDLGGAESGSLVRLDPLGRYLSEIRRYAPLDREEEQRLARVFRESGDPEAARQLVTANLVLVVKIARMFRRAVANLLDLIQEGNVGLIQALDRFDPEQGVRFSTYASWWVKAYILKYLLDNVRMVRVGTTNARRKLLYNLNREKRRLEEAGFSVGPRLLAEKFGVSERDVVDIEQSLAGGDLSLDAPVGEEGGATRGDLMSREAPSVEDEVARREFQELIEGKLDAFRRGLSDRDAAILDARLLSEEPATLQELGDRFGITREAVRQAEKKLTERLAEHLRAQLGEEAVLQFRRRR